MEIGGDGLYGRRRAGDLFRREVENNGKADRSGGIVFGARSGEQPSEQWDEPDPTTLVEFFAIILPRQDLQALTGQLVARGHKRK